MKLIDVARSRSLTFTKHALNITYSFVYFPLTKKIIFQFCVFFSKKRPYTHRDERNAHNNKKRNEKRKARELEEKYKQWPCVVFLSNTQNE